MQYLVEQGWPEARAHYLPNFVSAEAATPIPRRELLTPNDAPVILALGRLHKNKAFDIYRAKRTINPSPYMYYLKFGGIEVVGSSPEILVRLEDENVEVRPIAGTRKRGLNEEEDLSLEKDLLKDEKELAEHIMLVDL